MSGLPEIGKNGSGVYIAAVDSKQGYNASLKLLVKLFEDNGVTEIRIGGCTIRKAGGEGEQVLEVYDTTTGATSQKTVQGVLVEVFGADNGSTKLYKILNTLSQQDIKGKQVVIGKDTDPKNIASAIREVPPAETLKPAPVIQNPSRPLVVEKRAEIDESKGGLRFTGPEGAVGSLPTNTRALLHLLETLHDQEKIKLELAPMEIKLDGEVKVEDLQNEGIIDYEGNLTPLGEVFLTFANWLNSKVSVLNLLSRNGGAVPEPYAEALYHLQNTPTVIDLYQLEDKNFLEDPSVENVLSFAYTNHEYLETILSSSTTVNPAFPGFPTMTPIDVSQLFSLETPPSLIQPQPVRIEIAPPANPVESTPLTTTDGLEAALEGKLGVKVKVLTDPKMQTPRTDGKPASSVNPGIADSFSEDPGSTTPSPDSKIVPAVADDKVRMVRTNQVLIITIPESRKGDAKYLQALYAKLTAKDGQIQIAAAQGVATIPVAALEAVSEKGKIVLRWKEPNGTLTPLTMAMAEGLRVTQVGKGKEEEVKGCSLSTDSSGEVTGPFKKGAEYTITVKIAGQEIPVKFTPTDGISAKTVATKKGGQKKAKKAAFDPLSF